MFRLTLILLAGLAAAMAIGGRDLSPDEMAELGVAPRAEVHRAATELPRPAVPPPAAAPRVAAAPAGDDLTLAASPAAPEPQPEPAAAADAVMQAVELAMGGDAAEAGEAETPTVDEEIAAALTDAQVRYVNAERVNVRQGPSTDYGVVDQVVYGEATEILSDPSQEWVKIRIQGDGVEGWIASRFLQDGEPQG